MLDNSKVLTDGDCSLSYADVIAANPGNSDMALCELCDGLTPLDYCKTHGDTVCIYCHIGEIEHGLHQ